MTDMWVHVWDRVEDLLENFDSAIHIECASACAWSGELRLTLTNPEGAPSRSMTFFSAGGMDPEHVAVALLADAEAWLAESSTKPMPVPEWMRPEEGGP